MRLLLKPHINPPIHPQFLQIVMSGERAVSGQPVSNIELEESISTARRLSAEVLIRLLTALLQWLAMFDRPSESIRDGAGAF